MPTWKYDVFPADDFVVPAPDDQPDHRRWYSEQINRLVAERAYELGHPSGELAGFLQVGDELIGVLKYRAT